MTIIDVNGFVHIPDNFPSFGIYNADGFCSLNGTYWPEMNGILGGALCRKPLYFMRFINEGKQPNIIGL